MGGGGGMGGWITVSIYWGGGWICSRCKARAEGLPSECSKIMLHRFFLVDKL